MVYLKYNAINGVWHELPRSHVVLIHIPWIVLILYLLFLGGLSLSQQRPCEYMLCFLSVESTKPS